MDFGFRSQLGELLHSDHYVLFPGDRTGPSGQRLELQLEWWAHGRQVEEGRWGCAHEGPGQEGGGEGVAGRQNYKGGGWTRPQDSQEVRTDLWSAAGGRVREFLALGTRTGPEHGLQIWQHHDKAARCQQAHREARGREQEAVQAWGLNSRNSFRTPTGMRHHTRCWGGGTGSEHKKGTARSPARGRLWWPRVGLGDRSPEGTAVTLSCTLSFWCLGFPGSQTPRSPPQGPQIPALTAGEGVGLAEQDCSCFLETRAKPL